MMLDSRSAECPGALVVRDLLGQTKVCLGRKEKGEGKTIGSKTVEDTTLRKRPRVSKNKETLFFGNPLF